MVAAASTKVAAVHLWGLLNSIRAAACGDAHRLCSHRCATCLHATGLNFECLHATAEPLTQCTMKAGVTHLGWRLIHVQSAKPCVHATLLSCNTMHNCFRQQDTTVSATEMSLVNVCHKTVVTAFRTNYTRVQRMHHAVRCVTRHLSLSSENTLIGMHIPQHRACVGHAVTCVCVAFATSPPASARWLLGPSAKCAERHPSLLQQPELCQQGRLPAM